jgi:RNA:NAD 2'-phosphotransferase (TPT1/KptA family)
MPGKGGGRGGPMTREVQVSKKISWLLRHGAEKEGLNLGSGGYVNVKDVVRILSFFDTFHIVVILFLFC